VVVTNSRGKEPPLTELGQARRDAFAPGGGRDKNSPLRLASGESYNDPTQVNLADLYRLTPGSYKVVVTYDDRQPPSPLRLTAEAVGFEIR